MQAKKLYVDKLDELTQILDDIGSGNSAMMATRGVYVNVMITDVQSSNALLLKQYYNDVGAEVAISSDAYHRKEGVITDIVVLASLYQHREVRRNLSNNSEMRTLLDMIETTIADVGSRV